jgi:hypothetical protein
MQDVLEKAFSDMGWDEGTSYAEEKLDERIAEVGAYQAAIECVMSEHRDVLPDFKQVEMLCIVVRQFLIERTAKPVPST